MSKKRSTFVVGILVACLVLGMIGVVAASKTRSIDDVQWSKISYTVQKGDTLWDISKEYCPDDIDVRDYISLIKKENAIGSTLYAGQKIFIFKEK